MGQDIGYVFGEIVGMSESDIAALRDSGVLR